RTILPIERDIRTERERLVKTWKGISRSMPILAESMTTEITVTGENMVIRAVISRDTVKAIELATSPCFASTNVAFGGCKSERRHTNIHTRDYSSSSEERK